MQAFSRSLTGIRSMLTRIIIIYIAVPFRIQRLTSSNIAFWSLSQRYCPFNLSTRGLKATTDSAEAGAKNRLGLLAQAGGNQRQSQQFEDPCATSAIRAAGMAPVRIVGTSFNDSPDTMGAP